MLEVLFVKYPLHQIPRWQNCFLFSTVVLRFAMELAEDYESDSLQVVKAIGGLKQGPSPMDLLVGDIRVSLRGFDICYVR